MVAQGLQDLVVLPPQLIGRGVEGERVAHEDDDAFNPHAVGEGEQLRHLLVGSAAFETTEVAMQVPDEHGASSERLESE